MEQLRAFDPWAVFTTHQEGALVHYRTASHPGFDAAHPIATIGHADPELMRLQGPRQGSPAPLLGLALLAALILAVVA